MAMDRIKPPASPGGTEAAKSFMSGHFTRRKMTPALLVCFLATVLYGTRETPELVDTHAPSSELCSKPWKRDTARSLELSMSLRRLLSGDLSRQTDAAPIPLQRVDGPVALTAPGQARLASAEDTAAAAEIDTSVIPPSATPPPDATLQRGPELTVESLGLPPLLHPRRAPGAGIIEEIIDLSPEVAVAPNQPLRQLGDGPGMGGNDYTTDVRRLLKPIRQVELELDPPQGDFHPGRPDPKEQPRITLARDLFAEAADTTDGFGRVRPWPGNIVYWTASGQCHRPLYFEEVNLERYGYSFGLAQPAVSAAHFFGRIPALPYLMTADPPPRCVYTLGHYRPGTPTPLYLHRVPVDPLAAAVQGGVMTGLVYLVP